MIKKGFTLIELMVVVLIVGLLSGLVIVNVNNSRIAARDARRIADLGTISSALAQYYADKHAYPASRDDLKLTYISIIPKDPQTNVDYPYLPYPNSPSCTTAGNSCTCYLLTAQLENSVSTYVIKNGEIGGATSTCP